MNDLLSVYIVTIFQENVKSRPKIFGRKLQVGAEKPSKKAMALETIPQRMGCGNG
jgi:hypothetical protein